MNITTQAVGLAKPLKDFAQYYEHEELSLTLRKVNDIQHEIKLEAPKYQKTISDFFSFLISIITLKAFPTRKSRSKYTAPPLKYTTDIL